MDGCHKTIKCENILWMVKTVSTFLIFLCVFFNWSGIWNVFSIKKHFYGTCSRVCSSMLLILFFLYLYYFLLKIIQNKLEISLKAYFSLIFLLKKCTDAIRTLNNKKVFMIWPTNCFCAPKKKFHTITTQKKC